ncbi:MAG: porin family protein [Gammaproteobacteria bacterium]|nr:porin family protein [Gammaproteobacteria bacterium]
MHSRAPPKNTDHTAQLNSDGFIGGGQIGYAVSLYNKLIAGLETDFQGVTNTQQESFSQTSAQIVSPDFETVLGIPSNIVISKGMDYFGTLRGRLGYPITTNVLFSGTAGLAYAKAKANTNIIQGSPNVYQGLTTNSYAAGNYSSTRIGWTAGGNIEWMFHSNWSAKIEYLYYDLGSVTYNAGQLSEGITNSFPTSTIFTNAVRATTRFDGQIIRVGVNYYFA